MRDLIWVGSSLDDLRDFPEEVLDLVGYALWLAQTGGKHPDAKPLSGFGGAGVLEIPVNEDGDTYRAVYTLTLPDAIYVLHAFQKRSTRGIATPTREIEQIRRRLRQAQEMSAQPRKEREGKRQ